MYSLKILSACLIAAISIFSNLGLTQESLVTKVWNIKSLRTNLQQMAPAKQRDALLQFHQRLQNQVDKTPTNESMKAQDLMSLQILLAPIISLINSSPEVRDCQQTKHDIEFMERFGEGREGGTEDEADALAILALFCDFKNLSSAPATSFDEKKK